MRYFFILTTLCCALHSFAQSPMLSARVQVQSFSGIEIQRLSIFDPAGSLVGSVATLGFEGRVQYMYPVRPRWFLKAGAMLGTHPFGVNLYAVDFDSLAPDAYISDKVREYAAWYFGGTFEGMYWIPLTSEKRSNVGISAGMACVYHFPAYLSVGYSYINTGGGTSDIFEADLMVNPNRRLTLAGILGIDYLHRVSRNLYASIGANALYSARAVIQSTNDFRLSSGQSTLNGRFNQRFVSAGINVGIHYKFGRSISETPE